MTSRTGATENQSESGSKVHRSELYYVPLALSNPSEKPPLPRSLNLTTVITPPSSPSKKINPLTSPTRSHDINFTLKSPNTETVFKILSPARSSETAFIFKSGANEPRFVFKSSPVEGCNRDISFRTSSTRKYFEEPSTHLPDKIAHTINFPLNKPYSCEPKTERSSLNLQLSSNTSPLISRQIRSNSFQYSWYPSQSSPTSLESPTGFRVSFGPFNRIEKMDALPNSPTHSTTTLTSSSNSVAENNQNHSGNKFSMNIHLNSQHSDLSQEIRNPGLDKKTSTQPVVPKRPTSLTANSPDCLTPESGLGSG